MTIEEEHDILIALKQDKARYFSQEEFDRLRQIDHMLACKCDPYLKECYAEIANIYLNSPILIGRRGTLIPPLGVPNVIERMEARINELKI